MHVRKLKDNYKKTSLIYDNIMSGVNYKFWANYIFKLIGIYCNPKKSSVLELAAGNGNLSKYLYKKFDYYLISDISSSMLKNCKLKTPNIICFDMTMPAVKKQFDAVICSFDSVNYILSKTKLKSFFRNISEIVKDDGVFLFDVGLIKNSLHHQKFASKTGRVNNISFKRKSVFLNKSRIHKNIFTFYFEDGSYSKEIHRQKIYQLNDYFDVLDKSNFYVVECLKAFTFKDCSPNNFRAQFVVKRKNKC